MKRRWSALFLPAIGGCEDRSAPGSGRIAIIPATTTSTRDTRR